jgi:predicted RNase H-like nuclease
MLQTVIGVDGCPAGWIAVIWNETIEHRLFTAFADIVALSAVIIAVDMPIGLPDMSGRQAEREARKVLGARQSSVFAIPSRAAVMCEDYRDACAINLQHSDPPKKIAKQTFHLFSKIREIDALMSPEAQTRIHEVHPEVAFWAMNDRQPLPLAKKVKSQSHSPGLELRRALLQQSGFPVASLPAANYRRADVGDDDLIDACACAWSARRILDGTSLCFPEQPPRDERGLSMCIKA